MGLVGAFRPVGPALSLNVHTGSVRHCRSMSIWITLRDIKSARKRLVRGDCLKKGTGTGPSFCITSGFFTVGRSQSPF